MATHTSRNRDIDGFLLLDKPTGITSNRALQKAKRICGARKAGHTGSLDPLATGMLPICFGAATKLSAYALKAGKTYEVEAELGTRTTTDDADGDVLEQMSAAHVTQAAVAGVLERFKGAQTQIPPMYSALKHDGRRLYELARKGVVVERQPRKVTIMRLELTDFAVPKIGLRVTCSTGTYIRTLVTDIACALGTLGHVTALRRTAVYPFMDEKMLTFEELESAAAEGAASLARILRPVDSVLIDWPELVLDPDSARRIRNGQKLPFSADTGEGWYRLYVGEREFVGIGEKTPDHQLVPRRIFL